MLSGPTEWLREFLAGRDLDRPDGRALYAYRCTSQEFESLEAMLIAHMPHVQIRGSEETTVRAFALYASEWWQRKYDGRQWAWEPLLASIGWDRIFYPDLYAPVKKAWEWWKVDLVRLPTSVRYLGTFACQGGLPLALIGSADHRLTPYLRAVLKHTAAYRQFVDDPIELARDKQQLLRPPTLRRDYVFRLAADLIEAVLDLEIDIEVEDPLKTLDETSAGWRSNMPLDLYDAHAKELLSGLLREANRSGVNYVRNFAVDRFLRDTSGGLRLGARVRLPLTISRDQLARLIGVSPTSLPHRLQVNLHGDRAQTLGVYAERTEDFLLMRNQQTSSAEIWDASAASEVKLRFRSGAAIGELVVPNRGSALGDLPWTFRGDRDDYVLIGEGSVSNRSPELLVLVPEGCEVKSEDGPHLNPARVLDRTLWRVYQPTTIITDSGRCIVRPSSEHQAEEHDYSLSGQRLYSLGSAWPIFFDMPTLRVAKTEQAARSVPVNEIAWRHGSGDWQPQPNANVYGLWELRHVRGGELRYLGRVGIVPPKLEFSLKPGKDMSEGEFLLSRAEAVKVATDNDTGIECSISNEGDALRVHVSAHDRTAPPVCVQLRLHWRDANELVVQAPFPGHGARFLRDGEALESHDLAVDDLYGIRATALSPQKTEFWIDGTLDAPDLGDLLRVAHFRQHLYRHDITHELALYELRPMIEQLLAASSSSDAEVKLQILDRAQRIHACAKVRRFATVPTYDDSMRFVAVADEHGNHNGAIISCEALPLARPSDEPVSCSVVTSENRFQGAMLPQDMNMSEPWLVVARYEDLVRISPIVVGGAPSDTVGVRENEAPRLFDAVSLADPALRRKSIAAAIDSMLNTKNENHNKENWQFLENALLCASEIPATASDLLKVLTMKPQLMVRCLFRLEKNTPPDTLEP